MPEHPVSPRTQVPQGDAEILKAATAQGLPLLPECASGVAANLAMLARHTRIMRGGAA